MRLKNKQLLTAGWLLCVLLTQCFADPVRSAAEPDYPPLSVVNSDGNADGFSVELLRAALAEMGMDVSFQTGAWSKIKTDLAEGRLDVLPVVGRTPEREALFDFTAPYLTLHGALFVREDNPRIGSPEDLRGQRIAVMKGDNAEEYVRRARLSETIIGTTNFDEAFQMLSDGRADAVIAQKLMGLANIRESGKPIDEFKQDFCFAVKKGNARLLATLNEGLSVAIAKGTFRQLEHKWIYPNKDVAVLKRTLVFSDDFASPPNSFLDENGRPTGFNVELLRAVAKKTGLNISFELVPWGEVLGKMQRGAVDISCMHYPNPDKGDWVDFSVPHSISYRAVFARRDSPPYKTPADLKGRRISVQGGGALEASAQQLGGTPTPARTLEGALDLLEKKQADFALCRLLPGRYWIQKNGWKNLYAVDPRLEKTDYCYVVQKGNTTLLDLLNDGLERVKGSGEYRQIYNQWLGVLEPESLWHQVKKFVLPALAAVVLLIVLVGLIIFSLERQVKKRTLEFDAANQSLKESRQAALNLMEDAVMAKERLELTQFALDQSGDSAFWADSAGRFVYANGAACRKLGYDKEELLRLSVFDIDPDMPQERWLSHWLEIKKKKSVQFESRHRTKDGRVFPVEIHLSYIKYGDKEHICTFAHDITSRKEAEKRLRFEQDLFRSFMDIIPANVYFKDTNGRFVYVNKSEVAFSGMKEEGLIGKTDFDLFPENQARKKFEDEQLVMQTGQPIQIEELSGETWHLTNKAPRYDENGAVAGTFGISWDITSRITAQQKFEESQRFLRTVIDSIPTRVFWKDRDLTYLGCNLPFAHDVGLASPEEVVGKIDFGLAVPKEQSEAFRTDDRAVIESGTPKLDFEEPQTRQDGALYWLKTNKIPLKNIQGEIVGVIGTYEDITERRRMQAAIERRIIALTRPLDNPESITFDDLFDLKEIQRIQDEFATATGVASIITWPDGTPITRPSNYSRLCQDIIQKTEKGCSNCFKSYAELGRLYHPKGPTIEACVSGGLWVAGVSITIGDRYIANWQIGQVRDETQTEENMRAYAREIGADEKTFIKAFREVPVMPREHFEQIAQALFTLASQLSASAYQNIQQARFIAEEKKNQAELLRLSTAIEQSSEAVMITGLGGIIQYVNPAFETITGYSREEALGKTTKILESGKHDKPFFSNLWQTITSGKTWKGRFINKRKTGELYTEDAVISAVRDPSGTITGYVAVKRDITQELVQEEAFRQSQKMEAVGQLSGGIAHDFNNILQAVLGFSEILLKRLNKDSMEHRDALEIQKAAKRAAEMTRQLLAFSRKQSVELKRIDLNATVRDTEVLLRLLLGDQTKLTFVPHSALHEIYADHGQLTQIMMNLALNARDAMPDGGHLTITTENAAFGPQAVDGMPGAEPGSFVCLSFTDTGCGMSREVKNHLFEPFFTTKEVGQGTGLGLSVVYGIVKQSKGWIHVDSEEGRGSTLKIYLPACETPEANDQKDRTHDRRILLVEDDEGWRKLVVQILESAGYETVAAASAEEALELFKQQKDSFALLFSDILLPGKNGIELADTLREIKPGLPVLLYSGYQDQRERWNHFAFKKYHFLQKPSSMTGMLAAVQEALTETI